MVTTLLVAMVAMLFTAFTCYRRMARAYPSAGSAFTYVGRELDRRAGCLVGWSMLMDYLLCPSSVSSGAAKPVLPHVPYWGWVIFFVVLSSRA